MSNAVGRRGGAGTDCGQKLKGSRVTLLAILPLRGLYLRPSLQLHVPHRSWGARYLGTELSPDGPASTPSHIVSPLPH